MADQEQNAVTAEERWDDIQNYFERNKKRVTTVATIVIVVIGGILGYFFWYLPGQEEEAENSMYKAQMYFNLDSINLAMNGNAAFMGFQSIADQYGMTKAGHLANYYLGICYYDKKEYQKAIDCLEKFNAGDALVSPNAAGVMGDAEMQLNQPDKALEYYMNAVKRNDNNFTTPIYLKKAAMVCEIKGDYNQAADLYTRIKTEYHSSSDAQDIDKYIYRAKAKAGTL